MCGFLYDCKYFEGLLHECGIDICRKTVRFRWLRFGLFFAAEMRNRKGFRYAASPPAVASVV